MYSLCIGAGRDQDGYLSLPNGRVNLDLKLENAPREFESFDRLNGVVGKLRVEFEKKISEPRTIALPLCSCVSFEVVVGGCLSAALD